MKRINQIGMVLLIGIIIGFNVAKAQGTGDSIVQITADAQGLSLVSPDQLPPIGTYWMISPGGGPNGCVQAPLPFPPSGGLPIFQVADGEFIVDGTVGETVSETVLEAQAVKPRQLCAVLG
jgi:hypothetical protein